MFIFIFVYSLSKFLFNKDRLGFIDAVASVLIFIIYLGIIYILYYVLLSGFDYGSASVNDLLSFFLKILPLILPISLVGFYFYIRSSIWNNKKDA